MRRRFGFALFVVFCVSFLVLSSGCKKRTPAAAPTAPPPARSVEPAARVAAPTIELNADPTTIERGQQSTLTWKTANAASVVIDGGVGNVGESGSVVISPLESTTFTATAQGAGGEAKSSTRVTVVGVRDTPQLESADIRGLQQAIDQGKVRPVFFDYDKAELSSEARRVLEENAKWFRQFASVTVIVEGHCDERGTEEYNLALGDRRAQAVKDYLIQVGVDGDHLEGVSYGEERPFAQGHDDASYAQNRRAHFSIER